MLSGRRCGAGCVLWVAPAGLLMDATHRRRLIKYDKLNLTLTVANEALAD